MSEEPTCLNCSVSLLVFYKHCLLARLSTASGTMSAWSGCWEEARKQQPVDFQTSSMSPWIAILIPR